MNLPELIRRWQRGWGLARGLAPAEDISAVDGAIGLRVTLDLPGRYQELIALDASVGRQLAAEAAKAPRPTWVSVIGDKPELALREFTEAGLEQLGGLDSLMTIDLADHPVRRAPEGYTVESTLDGPVLRVRVTASDGSLAASGMAGLWGTDAVAHAIATEPQHRRRGLGSVVMSTLAQEAAALGAGTGLLVAVPEGILLYTALGWTQRADFVSGRLAAA